MHSVEKERLPQGQSNRMYFLEREGNENQLLSEKMPESRVKFCAFSFEKTFFGQKIYLYFYV